MACERVKPTLLTNYDNLHASTLKVGTTGHLEMSVTANLRCMTFQKTEDPIYTAEKPESTQKYIRFVLLIVRSLD